jgi:hypothetical protein
VKRPKPTEVVLSCFHCAWQVDAACRTARGAWGNSTVLFKVLAEVYDEHVRECHPELIRPDEDETYSGYALLEPLPRWWVTL